MNVAGYDNEVVFLLRDNRANNYNIRLYRHKWGNNKISLTDLIMAVTENGALPGMKGITEKIRLQDEVTIDEAMIALDIVLMKYRRPSRVIHEIRKHTDCACIYSRLHHTFLRCITEDILDSFTRPCTWVFLVLG